jgi:hypothetical protein
LERICLSLHFLKDMFAVTVLIIPKSEEKEQDNIKIDLKGIG